MAECRKSPSGKHQFKDGKCIWCGTSQSGISIKTELKSEVKSLHQLIKERAHMVPILSSGLDVAYLLGKWMPNEKARDALKLLTYTLDASLITHKWDEAERWAEKLRRTVSMSREFEE